MNQNAASKDLTVARFHSLATIEERAEWTRNRYLADLRSGVYTDAEMHDIRSNLRKLLGLSPLPNVE